MLGLICNAKLLFAHEEIIAILEDVLHPIPAIALVPDSMEAVAIFPSVIHHARMEFVEVLIPVTVPEQDMQVLFVKFRSVKKSEDV